jgi:hypothetical protein
MSSIHRHGLASPVNRWLVVAALASMIGIAPPAAVAATSPVGTWVKKRESGKPDMTLTIEVWGGNNVKLTYDLKGMTVVLTIEAKLDGTEAPLLMNGKPSGETMAIKALDKRHALTVVKMNGKRFGTSKASFSEDFNTLTVENEFTETVGANTAGKSTEIWLRK